MLPGHVRVPGGQPQRVEEGHADASSQAHIQGDQLYGGNVLVIYGLSWQGLQLTFPV